MPSSVPDGATAEPKCILELLLSDASSPGTLSHQDEGTYGMNGIVECVLSFCVTFMHFLQMGPGL